MTKINRTKKPLPKILWIAGLLLLLLAAILIACGKTKQSEENGPSDAVEECVEHEFDEGVVVKEPTCDEEGLKTYTCQKCGFVKEEVLEKIPTAYTMILEGVGVLHLPEDGKYSLKDPVKSGYRFIQWVDENGADFPSEGVVTQSLTIKPIFELLLTKTVAELAERAQSGADTILLANDIVIDRTIYVTGQTKLLASGKVKLTRAKNFGGDLFVVGEDSNGMQSILQHGTAELILGSSDGSHQITIDGNRDHLTAKVVGSAFFLVNGSSVSMYDGISISNHKKIGNERIHQWEDALQTTSTAVMGGAAVMIVHGTFNMYGGVIENNAVPTENLEATANTSAYGGAICNVGTFNMYGGTIKNNVAARGGAIYTRKRTNLYAGTLANNYAANKGGAIAGIESAHSEVYVGSADAAENTVIFQNNTAKVQGGVYSGAYLSQFVVLGGATFEGNRAEEKVGGVIVTTGSLILKNSKFIGNYAYEGGGVIYQYYAGEDTIPHDVLIEGCHFEENEAGRGGAIVISSAKNDLTEASMLTLVDCTFVGNRAVRRASEVIDETTGEPQTKYSFGSGGTIYIAKKTKLVIEDCRFEENTAEVYAGVLYLSGGTQTTISGETTLFEKNFAKKYGGAIYVDTADTLIIDGAIFRGNGQCGEEITLRGGAIYTANVAIETKNCLFEQNIAAEKGGAIYAATAASYTDGEKQEDGQIVHGSTFKENTSAVGGAICTYGTVSLLGTKLQGNSADESFFAEGSEDTANGGALYLGSSAVATLEGAVFEGNTAEFGGAIATYGTLTVINTSFEANEVTLRGGAIFVKGGTVEIIDSSFAANKAQEHGGALCCDGGAMTVKGSTFDRNEAAKNGGAIYVSTPLKGAKAAVTTLSCIFTSNKAGTNGGAVYVTSTGVYADGAEGSAEHGSTFGTKTEDGNVAVSGGAVFVYGTAKMYASTLSYNTAVRGGAIFVQSYNGASPGTLEVANAKFIANSATVEKNGYTNNGGAIYAEAVKLLKIIGCEFQSNTAGASGGAIAIYGASFNVQIKDCTFKENHADHGGAIRLGDGAAAEISGTSFLANQASTQGGAIRIDTIDAKLTGCRFLGNIAAADTENSNNNGGALYIYGGSAEIIDCRFEANYAGYRGGAIYATQTPEGESIVTVNCMFDQNTAKNNGGAIYLTGTAVYRDGVENESLGSSFRQNSAANGGAICSYGSVTLYGSFFAENTATTEGGAIYVGTSATLSTKDVTASGNTAGKSGGAIAVSGDSGKVATLSIIGGQMSENKVLNTGNYEYRGGAISIGKYVNATIDGVTFTSNTATSSGGAIGIYGASSNVEIKNCTVNGNSADNGGAIYVGGGSEATVTNLTAGDNAANTYGAVIYVTSANSKLTLTSATVYDNNTAKNISAGGLIHLANAANVLDIYKDQVTLLSATDSIEIAEKDWSVLIQNPKSATVNEKTTPVTEG